MTPARVWYLAYGSNVNRSRFLHYLAGGRTESGARDATPPARDIWLRAPLRLTFAKESRKWDGGGVAFVDPDPGGAAIVRAWDITGEQFEDVFAQENRLPVGTALDWPALATGPVSHGTGWYQRLFPVTVSLPGAQPAFTFSWAEPSSFRPPDDAYAGAIRTGLLQNPAMTTADVDAYLAESTVESI